MSVKRLLDALDERTIARKVGLIHEEARLRFSVPGASVKSFAEFMCVIGQYYEHHFSSCVAHGGHLSRSDAQQRARVALENHYRRQNGDVVMAFNDASDGKLRIVIDALADAIREEAVGLYVQNVFDTYVSPNSWGDKVEIIRQFLNEAAHILGDSVDVSEPARYAHDYQPLIQGYVEGVGPLKRNARRF